MRKTLTIDGLPPYGFINSDWMKGVADSIPPNMLIDGKPAAPASYRRWLNALVAELADHVWPRYDRSSGEWVGRARDRAMALTNADFHLLAQLGPRFTKEIHCRGTLGNLRATHRFFFLEEDQFTINAEACPPRFLQWGESYFKYDSKIPRPLANQLFLEFNGRGIAASADLEFQLKVQLQRPRAYQVAFLKGAKTFAYEFAHTAATPSMVSGHALQASISGCLAFLDLREELDKIPGARDHWAQFMVDVGDRRVFAGVHYPSDSVASWFCALRLARHIFGDQAAAARKFLWSAIVKKSAVHACVAEHARTTRGSPYRSILEWLETEALA